MHGHAADGSVDLGENRLSPGLFSPVEKCQKRNSIHVLYLRETSRFQDGRHVIDARDEMLRVDRSRRYLSRPPNDPRRLGAVEIHVGLGKRKGTAVITHEHHQCVFLEALTFEYLQDRTNNIVRSVDTGVIPGEFFTNLRQIR